MSARFSASERGALCGSAIGVDGSGSMGCAGSGRAAGRRRAGGAGAGEGTADSASTSS